MIAEDVCDAYLLDIDVLIDVSRGKQAAPRIPGCAAGVMGDLPGFCP